MSPAEDRSSGELGRSIDALTGEFRAFRDDFQRAMSALDDKYPRKEVVDLQIYDIRHDIAELRKDHAAREDFAANTRRMVYLALLTCVVLPIVTALLLALIRGH